MVWVIVFSVLGWLWFISDYISFNVVIITILAQQNWIVFPTVNHYLPVKRYINEGDFTLVFFADHVVVLSDLPHFCGEFYPHTIVNPPTRTLLIGSAWVTLHPQVRARSDSKARSRHRACAEESLSVDEVSFVRDICGLIFYIESFSWYH